MHIRPSVILFGDSITQFSFGQGDVKFGWGSLLSSAYQRRADVLNRGFSGYNTRHALDLVPRIFGSAKNNNYTPTYLFITVFFGANDATIPGERQHVPLAEYGENLTKIIHAIRNETQSDSSFSTSSLPIIVMTPPPIDEEAWKAELQLNDYYDRRNDVAREYGLEAKRVAIASNCLTLDTWELLGGDQEGYGRHLCDGLHLSESGNELIFNGLMQLIKTEYPDLSPQEMVDGKCQDAGIPPEEKLWSQLC